MDASERPLLPASSLKGVLRSTTERILRTIHPRLADRTFLQDMSATGGGDSTESPERYRRWLSSVPRESIADSQLLDWFEATGRMLPAPATLYPLLSAASQLFGATPHRGLVTLDDAHAPTPKLTPRPHVAIDRFTGGVGVGLYTDHLAIADQQSLETTLTVANFALYQIGLLALTFQELNRGYAGIGGGTRKGQGQVRIAVTSTSIVYEQRDPAERGIVSAQARLAGSPWNAADIPKAMRQIEHPPGKPALTLLDDLPPTSTRDWRDARRQRFELDQALTERFLGAAVAHAWSPWVDLVISEERS